MAEPRQFEQPGPARRPEREALEGRDGQRPEQRPDSPPAESDEGQRRLHHLMAAVENLRAAGLHEPAENLAREAEKMRQHFPGQTGPVPSRGPVPAGKRNPDDRGQMQRGKSELQNEVRELRQAVQELRKRLDELTRERR